jgi:hypothetical protein
MHPDFKRIIDNCSSTPTSSFNFKVDKCNIYISFWEFGNKKSSKTLFPLIKRHAKWIVEFLSRGFRRKLKTEFHLKINLYALPDKKTFPNTASDISYKNVNSGFFQRIDPTHGEIFVYREEEMFKVLIHELVHAFNTFVDHYYVIDGKRVNINEAVVETLACYLNCTFYSEITGIPLVDVINREAKYQKLQSDKVLHLLGRTNAYNTLQYYVIKRFLFSKLKIFLKECINDDNSINVSKIKSVFPTMDENFLKYPKNTKISRNASMRMTYHDIQKI